jgi:hypothetical protein
LPKNKILDKEYSVTNSLFLKKNTKTKKHVEIVGKIFNPPKKKIKKKV